MKKLTVLFSMVAISLTLSAAGCKKKNAEEGKDPAMKPEEKGSAAEVAKPDEKKPDVAAAPAGDFPAECTAYKAAVDKMMTCEKMKAAAGPMKEAFDTSWKQMEGLPAEGRAAMSTGCKAGADAIQQSLTAMGC
ncbi:MAG: hypothetical protein H0T79_18300 [Deltaproteobacteria bacterium]|nr:hypothetical protein [Deltaproteobacteria bacterium]